MVKKSGKNQNAHLLEKEGSELLRRIWKTLVGLLSVPGRWPAGIYQVKCLHHHIPHCNTRQVVSLTVCPILSWRSKVQDQGLDGSIPSDGAASTNGSASSGVFSYQVRVPPEAPLAPVPPFTGPASNYSHGGRALSYDVGDTTRPVPRGKYAC